MMSPVPIQFAGMLATTGLFFCLWHFWRYDGFRVLVPSRANAFLCIMCWTIVIALACLTAFTWMQAYVMYDVYYMQLKGIVMPVPAQLWPESHRQLWRDSLYVLVVGWVCMHAVHLEEFLYWAYLIDSIRKPSSRPTTWFRSVYCKLWIGGSIVCGALVGGAACIETADVQRMKAWIFLIGGSLSTLLALASTALSIHLPSFVRAVHASGASSEVVSRLAFYQELHFLRTVCRWVFGVCSMIQAADGITATQRINRLDFWPDFLTVTSLLSIFWALTISVVVLLPRNITSEAQPAETKQAMRQFHPRESRVPNMGPVPRRSMREAKKRERAAAAAALGELKHAGGAQIEDVDSDKLGTASTSSSSDYKGMSPSPFDGDDSDAQGLGVTSGPRRRHTTQAGGNGDQNAGDGDRTSMYARNNLHVLGERLNIDAQQLRDLHRMQDEEVMEMPELRHKPSKELRNGVNAAGRGVMPASILNQGSAYDRAAPHAQGEKPAIEQSPFDDVSAPAIRIHSPDSFHTAPAPVPVKSITTPRRTSMSGRGAEDTDSIDSLPYTQPTTTIEPQPSIHSFSPSDSHSHLSEATPTMPVTASPFGRARPPSTHSSSSRKAVPREHPFSASAVDRRARLQARDESEIAQTAAGASAGRELARFLDKGPGGPGPQARAI